MDRNVNTALNSTLSRTLNTAFTTLIVLLTMFFLGSESIRGLLFAIIIGVVVGTYSSLMIATPLMYDAIKKKGIDAIVGKKEQDEKQVEAQKAKA